MTRRPFNLIDVPAWAQWIAQDASGDWWAFEAEPNQGDIAWYENEIGRYVHISSGQKNPDWKATLKKWPRQKSSWTTTGLHAVTR